MTQKQTNIILQCLLFDPDSALSKEMKMDNIIQGN